MNRWEWRGNSTTTAVMVDGDAWTAAKGATRVRGARLPEAWGAHRTAPDSASGCGSCPVGKLRSPTDGQ
jgi:hypothetical protein